jgi:hypothetical protein
LSNGVAADVASRIGHASCMALAMLGIPRRYSHFVFGALQAGLTCLIAAGIASLPVTAAGPFLRHWAAAWLISWAAMLPVVLLAAPAIRALSVALTRDEPRVRSKP